MSVVEAPASFGQRLVWLMTHYMGKTGALNTPTLFKMRGALDQDALRAAACAVVARHEALRTSFKGGGRRLTQVIHAERAPEYAAVDIQHAGADALERALLAEIQTPIDPVSCPVRVRVWRVRPEEHVVCVNVHHLVTDAWSCGLVSRELGLHYDHLVAGGPAPPEVTWQYRDFARWQRETFEDGTFAKHRDYWSRKLSGMTAPQLPAAAQRAEVQARRVRFERMRLEAPVVAALQQLARSERTTLFTVMLTVYHALLYQLTEQADQAVSTIFANRVRQEARDTVGFIANMIVLRSRLRAGASFVQCVRDVRATTVEAMLHQELPFQMLTLAATGGATMRDSIFQMFAEPMHQATIGGLTIEPVAVPDGFGARFDLDLSLMPDRGGLEALLVYAPDRFEASWARQFLRSYTALAAAVASDADVRLTALKRFASQGRRRQSEVYDG